MSAPPPGESALALLAALERYDAAEAQCAECAPGAGLAQGAAWRLAEGERHAASLAVIAAARDHLAAAGGPGPALEAEREAHWRAGFLRGAKFWAQRTEPATMWQSDQNACWAASFHLWPPPPARIGEARAVVEASRAEWAETQLS